MSRSKWKGPYIELKNSELTSNSSKKSSLLLKVTRNTEVVPRFIGSSFLVHNGRNWVEIAISPEMIGYKFGEFVTTRCRFSFKKKNKK